MDLLQLKYFQTVARHEHLSRAAEELRISQPSLSQMIARLESDLGYKLFTRRGRSIELNEFGRAFLGRVNNVFIELMEGKRELDEIGRRTHEKISIAVTIPSIMPELVAGSKALNPDVRFRQYQSTSAVMLKQLESGEIDMAILTVEIQGDDLQWIPLLREELYLIVSRSHRFADRGSIRLNEVKSDSFVAMPIGHGFRDITEGFCREAGFKPNVMFEGDEVGIIQKLVAKGLGVALHPAMTSLDTAELETVKLRIESPLCFRTIGILLNKNRASSSTVIRFIEFIIEYFERFKAEYHLAIHRT